MGSRVSVFALVLGFVMFSAVPAQAQQDDKSVAVVALDDGARDKNLTDEVSQNLDRTELTVLTADELRARLEARQAPRPDQDLASRFTAISSVVASGHEAFFYKGPDKAIETLSPAFNLGIDHRGVLARRPDLAEQIYQAGILLVRAYEQQENRKNANAAAKILVKAFPSKSPSAELTPPKTISKIDEIRKEFEKGASELVIVPVEGEKCRTLVNGFSVEPEKAYAVASDTEYFVRLDCGSNLTPVWKVSVAEGETLRVPVPPVDPLEYRMKNGEFRARRTAENYLTAIAFWADVDTIVGVSRDAAPSNDAILVVRVEDDKATWSDSATERSVQLALKKVFPEFADQVGGDDVVVAGSTASDDGVDWVSWSLVGGGVASAGLGTYFLISAAQQAEVLRCSPSAADPAPESECEGVERKTFTDEAFEENLDAVTLREVVGYTTIGVGAGLLGWGIYRLATGRSETDASTARILVSPRAGGAEAAVRWRF